MGARFKPLAGQVVVVTGATSPIGLEVSRLAAKAGAAVLMAAADEHAVRQACDEIARTGGRVHPMAGDPATAEGCDRVARTAAARFGVIDSWIEAGGQEAALAHVAQALVRQIGARAEPAALVGFGRRVGAAALAELRQARGKVAATMIRLPTDWRHDSPAQAAAEAALHAVSRPMGHMVVATHGKRLTTATEARKHPGVMMGLGLLAVAGLAAWLNRERIASTAAAARPRVARAVRPMVIRAVKQRPLQSRQARGEASPAGAEIGSRAALIFTTP